jgi:hypothetical protein
MSGPVEMFKNLSPKVSGYQRLECAGGRVTDEVKVVDLVCDDAQTLAGAESLYLWAKNLAEGHIIQGRSVGDGFADLGGPAEAAAGRDSMSAKTFDIPDTYRT